MATRAQTELAAWLLAKEIDGEANEAGLAAAAERVCQKLSRPLTRLVSPRGAQAVLSRALHYGQAQFPFLEEVYAGAESEACFEKLDEHVHDVGVAEAREGLLAALGILLDLLLGFIGEALTLRLVLEVWPDLPVRERSRFANSEGQEPAS